MSFMSFLSPIMGLLSAHQNDKTDKRNFALNEEMYRDQQRRQRGMDAELEEAKKRERFRRREFRPGEEEEYAAWTRNQVSDPSTLAALASAFTEQSMADDQRDAGIRPTTAGDLGVYMRQAISAMPGVNRYDPGAMNSLFQTQLYNQTGGPAMHQHSSMMNSLPSSLYLMSQNAGRGGYDSLKNYLNF